MKNGAGAARLICVFTVCILLLGYNFYGRFLKTPAVQAVKPVSEKSEAESYENSSSAPEETEKKEETESGGSTSSAAAASVKSETSVPAAAKGTVKGKIINNYISPYKAGLSYNNVYVKNSAGVNISIKELLSAPLTFKIEKNDKPQVLIMHTHTTETYMTENTDYYTDAFSPRSRDKSVNMVSVGDIVAEKLNAAGIKTLHDTTEHDYPKYTGSYTRAAKTINGYLKKYPSIKIVLDLHRAAASSGNDKVKLTTEIGGKRAAQVMIVMGSQSGTQNHFPNWKENLKLALRLQQTIESKYPTLARPLSLTPNGYNECLTNGSLLIEFGTDANTVDEAHYSAELVGNSLADLLNNLK